MINVKELRIGNRVLADFGKERGVEEIEIYQINESGVVYDHHCDEHCDVFLSPFPINKTFLEALGFIKDKSSDFIKFFLPIPKLNCEIHAIFFRGKFIIEIHNDLKPIITECEYLHQLQNLYFALTGEELSLKND